jgi:hypothetical protein
MITIDHTWQYPIKRKAITFCVTCRNRLWQLKQTLGKNLAILDDDIEITLVDYGSTDEISQWVWSNFKEYIESGNLNFFEVKNDVTWNVSKAKNLAHRISNGEYLFNLDADNFITPIDIKLIRHAKDSKVISHQWSGNVDGSYGRIGYPRSLFFSLGGYDEAMLPMGFEDIDFLRRSKNLINHLKLPGPSIEAIKNTFEQSVSEINTDPREAKKIYELMINFNNNLSKFKLSTEEGPSRNTGFTSYKGALNGSVVTIDGFNQIRALN